MSTDQVTITFKCLNCGGSVLELPDDATNDSVVVCKSCRVPHGRYGDLKAKSIELVAAEATKIARTHFDEIKRVWNRRR